MNRIILLLLSSFIFSHIAAQTPGKLIIKFKEGASYNIDYKNKHIEIPVLNSIPEMGLLKELSSLVPRGLPENKQLKKLDLIRNIHFITLPDNTEPGQMISKLMATGLFEYVEKDEMGTGSGVTVVTPNDPNFSLQWSLKNNGTFSGTAVVDADIDMDEAWDLTTGDANTIVCVLDAGFRLTHPELSGRIWQNPGEIPGNAIDDDGNGYIDDTQGWDWANSDNNPTDDHGHGTNVGSVIAAKGNNSSIMAGINWNCKLMVGKILDASNSGFYSWWTSGIYYAVNKGAKVINMSVGGSSFSSTMKDACDFAMANNVIVVVCMHNQNTSAPYYPAAYASVIAVGSTSDNDKRTVPFPWSPTSGSNYGSHIDLVAPGNNILGLLYNSNTGFNYWAGTSQATPEVTGVISLMAALKPNISFAQTYNILATTSQDGVGGLPEDTPGWDQYYGYGRLNARSALNAVIVLLPLKFGDISATRKSNYNQVQWSTYSETNLAKFSIEYSPTRTGWSTIDEVAPSNSTSEKHYSVNHVTDDKADAFYRIKATDNDGAYQYSKIVRINKKDLPFSISNVIADKASVNIFTNATRQTDCVLYLYAMDGKLYYKTKTHFVKGDGSFLWNVNLSPGRYQVIALSEDQKISVPVLVK